MARKIRRTKTIPYKFGSKHKEYIRKCEAATINVAEGAVRAGKTIDNIMAFAHELKKTKDKIHLASASTIGNAKIIIGDSNGLGLEHIFRGQCRWGKYKGNEALIICGADTGYKARIIIFAGAMLSNSFKSIRGNSYGLWIATEINLHDKEFIKEAFNRSLAADTRKIFWDLNPDNPKAWIYEDYIDKYEKNSKEGRFIGGYNYEHFTIDDNINISNMRKAEIKSQYDPNSLWYKRDILGQRIAAEGLIFQDFANDSEKWIIESCTEKITLIQIGVDFGGNKSKTVFVATAVIGNFDKLIVVDDHKIEGEKGTIDPAKIEKDFLMFLDRVTSRYGAMLVKIAWCDNEAQTLINGLRGACHRARKLIKIADCYKAPVNDRIAAIAMLLAQSRFFILSCCKNVINSLKGQIWDPKQKTEDIRLDDGTCDIDTADALEYSFCKFLKELGLKGG